jgi:hypothetical protein
VNQGVLQSGAALRHVFIGKTGPRKQLHRSFDRGRTFRNRIAHHEPIFHRHLAADHMHIVRLVRLICPVTADWVSLNSKVSKVLAVRPVPGAPPQPSSF